MWRLDLVDIDHVLSAVYVGLIGVVITLALGTMGVVIALAAGIMKQALSI